MVAVMILNIDQTPLKYVSIGSFTLTKKGAKSLTMEGSNDKRCITATCGLNLNNNFLLIQLIYAGKTNQSLPCYKLIVNPTHYSNSTELVKLTDEIVAPYLENKWKKLHLPHFSINVYVDVYVTLCGCFHWSNDRRCSCSSQHQNHIFVVNMPANMTGFY